MICEVLVWSVPLLDYCCRLLTPTRLNYLPFPKESPWILPFAPWLRPFWNLKCSLQIHLLNYYLSFLFPEFFSDNCNHDMISAFKPHRSNLALSYIIIVFVFLSIVLNHKLIRGLQFLIHLCVPCNFQLIVCTQRYLLKGLAKLNWNYRRIFPSVTINLKVKT